MSCRSSPAGREDTPTVFPSGPGCSVFRSCSSGTRVPSAATRCGSHFSSAKATGGSCASRARAPWAAAMAGTDGSRWSSGRRAAASDAPSTSSRSRARAASGSGSPRANAPTVSPRCRASMALISRPMCGRPRTAIARNGARPRTAGSSRIPERNSRRTSSGSGARKATPVA